MLNFLIDRFNNSVQMNPSAESVILGNQRVKYSELYILTGRISAYLTERDIKKGDRVALLVSNSPEYIAIYYAVLSAGGVVVALNTQSKIKDISNWLQHSGAKWLFVDHNHPELPLFEQLAGDIRIVTTGYTQNEHNFSCDNWDQILGSDSKLPDISIKSNDLAAIIYTSGTTGHPKGVTLTHGNLAANISSILEYLKLSPNDSIVNVLPFYYSYGNSVLHTHLSAGGRLILENNLVYPHKVVQKIVDEAASGFSGVPSTFALLLGRVKLSDYDLSCLRYLTQAGGPMAPALTQRLTQELPHANLYVMYGQTEATARLTYLPPSKLMSKKASIGIPIQGVEIEIRDKENNPVNEGVTGEICAKGDNIMQGYWQDQERTAATIKDGWLFTGDLAHYDADGYIYIDGRSSDMIKAGANRISPKEIEEVIQELTEVQEVAVIGVPDDMLGEVIKAFIVTSQDQSIDKKRIQLHCKKNLASYKIPKQIEFISELPKTASGKIKKYQLK